MSVFRGIDGSRRIEVGRTTAVASAHPEARRIGRSVRIAVGTLACSRCDAPVALTAGPVTPTDTLTCPFCGRRAPARDFLSLASPTRPARVVVHAIYDAR